MVMANLRFKLSVLIAFIAVLFSLIFYFFEMHAPTFSEVLEIQLPNGVKCFDEQVDSSPQNMAYQYRALFVGENNALIDVVNTLGMEEEVDIEYYDEPHVRELRAKWWIPGSVYGKGHSRYFRKRGKWMDDMKRPLFSSQAELVDNKLYFRQSGSIDSITGFFWGFGCRNRNED